MAYERPRQLGAHESPMIQIVREELRGASERDDGQMPPAADKLHFDLEAPWPTTGQQTGRGASSRGAGAVWRSSGPPQESLVDRVAEIINYWDTDRSLARSEVQKSLDHYTRSTKRRNSDVAAVEWLGCISRTRPVVLSWIP